MTDKKDRREPNDCLGCDCYDPDMGCTMSSIDRAYACPLEDDKEMVDRLCVGDLREALEGVPDDIEVDDLEIRFDSEESYEVVLKQARHIKDDYVDGEYFSIYGNAEDE